jgi:hypothetical protein
MPAWGANAGLTLVDMCPSGYVPKQTQDQDEEQSETQKQGEQSQITIKPIPVDDPSTQGPSPDCLRRVCTEVASTLSMTLETPLVPINFSVFVGAIIGFSHARFEVLCKTLPQPGEVRP